MLLYVDKKKQKRERLKIIFTTLATFFFLCTNIIFFNTRLQQTEQHLTNYHPIEQKNTWYTNSDVITIFTKKNSPIPHALIIPETITRENLSIIALAFSKLENTPFEIECTKEIKEEILLQKLATIYQHPSHSNNSPKHKLLISTNITTLSNLIQSTHLIPNTLHYQNTKKLENKPNLQSFLNTHFPRPAKPQTPLEQEKYALESFVSKYKKELQNLFSSKPQKIAFTSQNLFLQNVGICLSLSEKQHLCELNSTSSLEKSIRSILEQISSNSKPQKLILLTSLQETPTNTLLAKDEGAMFTYGKRQSFLLPHEKDKKINTYTLLKQRAGLNPDYYSSNMKFYKFKTTEIDINDNI